MLFVKSLKVVKWWPLIVRATMFCGVRFDFVFGKKGTT